ncbi:MAG: HD domain-containing protein [Phycisphaera sp.]|nr:HD domain-containing protein [Phycisphaera sp.]
MDFELANALGRIVELKDRSTGAHTWRVTMYAQAMAEAARVETPRLMNFMLGAVLHDLGKIDVPDGILAKPGRLDDEEFKLIQKHTIAGHDRLLRMGVTEPIVLDVVRSHHERIDGTGYPDGLAGEQIPLAARWFSVIDGFDAMTSLRSYRDGRGDAAAEKALLDLESHTGSWYEPEAVAVFRDLYERGRLDSTLEHLNDPAGHATLTGPLSDASAEIARKALLLSNPPGADSSDVDHLLELATRAHDPGPRPTDGPSNEGTSS